jgi:hypothetical protein
MIEVVTNLHIHTPYSDGEWYHKDIAAAAARAGLDAIIVTDHNVHVGGIEGYYDGVMLLVGEEVHDCLRRPQSNHCLIYGTDEGMSPYAAQPQKLIDETKKRNGLAFPAHIFDYGSPLDFDLDGYPWTEWNLRGLNGVEIWNYMTEYKKRLVNFPSALLATFFPSLMISGPFRESLQQWDALNANYTRTGVRYVGIGNADAHGIIYHKGPLRTVIFPYDYLFRCVNTHVLLERRFNGDDLAGDKQMLLEALQNGRCFVGYDLGADTRGFTFTGISGAGKATMGDEIRRRGVVNFKISTPQTANIRLLRDGAVVAQRHGRALEFTTVEPGVYRVEVYRTFRLRSRGWIFSNPIYVR